MDSAATTAVPAIDVPEDVTLDWITVYLCATPEQYAQVAPRLEAEKDAKADRRFDAMTGKPVQGPLTWKENGVTYKLEVRAPYVGIGAQS